MVTLLRLAVTGFMLIVLPLSAQQGSGQIRGQVLDATGLPISGATVSAYPTDLAEGRKSIASLSGQDGNFALDRLSAGAYQLCAEVSGGELLNPCSWDARSGAVNVAANQQLSGVQIRQRKGVPLLVRIDDPSQLLGTSRYLMVGVWTTAGLYQPARLASTDAQGRSYSLTIPVDTPIKLKVGGANILISDENGQPVKEADAPLTFQASSSDAQKVLRFRIDALQN